MATNTSHYNLVKPAYSDTADIADINGNMDIIDSEIYNTNTAIGALRSDFTRETGTCTAGTNITLNDVVVEKSGNVCVLHGVLSITGTVAGNNAVVLTIPSGFRPSSALYVRLWATYGGTLGLTKFYIGSNGSLVSNRGNSTLSDTIQLEITYII